MKIISKNLKQTSRFAKSFLDNLKPSSKMATVVALSGNLGSAKTTFTKEIASFLGVPKKEITSPTFVIMKIYQLTTDNRQLFEPEALRAEWSTTNNKKNKNKKNTRLLVVSRWSHLIHIDAYRLDSHKELLHLGWKEILKNYKNLVIIEWPERVKKILPKSTKWTYFKFVDEKTRKIEIKNVNI
ncbi:MAG TPA: tRNA (adenosine(37)-N6)-threonylcarbamoyltransferase complex ATPase subunit type 1 TsaE [Candidatus Paceibacterota bacterium]